MESAWTEERLSAYSTGYGRSDGAGAHPALLACHGASERSRGAPAPNPEEEVNRRGRLPSLPMTDSGDPGRAADEPPEVLTLEEAAAFMRLSVPTMRRLAEAGDVPSSKLGNQWRFSRRALLQRLGWEEP